MTMKLFIAFLSILFEYCNMNCKFSPLPPLLICLLQFLHANRTRMTLRERGGEKGSGRPLTRYLLTNSDSSLCFMPVL